MAVYNPCEAVMRILCSLVSVIGTLVALPVPAATHTADVVVYGGTASGVMTAVQVARLGKSVLIVSPDTHLGGMTSGGLGWTDAGNMDAVGGLALEYYRRMHDHYAQDSEWRQQTRDEFIASGPRASNMYGKGGAVWSFEPHVAEALFDAYIAEHKIPVHRDAWLDREKGVRVEGTRIVSITTLAGDTFTGQQFIDATYEGDLMAAAGVSYHVGREANAVYGEEWNGVQVGILHHGHHFKSDVSPYVVPGDPASGLLPRVSGEDPGKRGEADQRIQAYCFRMCLTDAPENRVPFAKPDGYDAGQYTLLARVLATGWNEVFQKFDPIPNRKTDTNNHGPFSTDNIGMNYDYPEGSYARRREIIKEHEQYQKGLMYFLANDPQVPEAIRTEMSRWGLAKDEFTDNGNWPHQIYVREARRMVGAYVMTEHDVLNKRPVPKPVGMGSYTMDSHNVQRYVKPDGFVQNEGDIGVKTPTYQISYDSLTPKKDECTNLLVPVCASSSHIAYGSIRMEPVFMILGQSAGAAAVQAIEAAIPVQEVDYGQLKATLEAADQRLSL
jgi:hypothetical protein